MKVSCHLRVFRKEKNLTQEDLARTLGISRQSIISVESGKSTPSLSLALNIAKLFESSIEDIFEFGKNINKPIMFGRKESKMSRDLTPWRNFGIGRFFDEDEFEQPKLSSVSMPAVDVYEQGDNVVVETQLPGIDPDNVKIEVTDDVLKIIGEKKEEKEEKEKNYYHREMSYGVFARSIVLPTKVITDKSEADYKDGILKITLPKVEEKKAKSIQVKVNKKK